MVDEARLEPIWREVTALIMIHKGWHRTLRRYSIRTHSSLESSQILYPLSW